MKREARPQAFIEFESLAATIPDIVYRIDEDGIFTYLNAAIRKLGYEPDDLIGKHFSELILPADVKSVSRKHILPWFLGKTGSMSPKLFDERRGVERKTSQLEVRLLSRSGSRAISGKIKDIGSHQIVAEVSSSGIFRNKTGSQDGVFLGTVGIIRDITSQRWMEAELIRHSRELEKQIKESKEISTVILESSPIGLFIVSNNEFQFANKSFLKITGYTLEQIKGRNVLDFIAPEDREIVRLSAIGMLKHGISYPYEYRAIDINKNIHWIRETVASIHYNGKRATLGNFIDVTDRKQIEEQLIQSERKYATLVENSMDGIAILQNGLIVFANSRLSKITGISNEDVAGKTFLDFVSPGLRGFFREMYEKRLLGQDVPNDFELELISHAGENITIEMTLRLITHEDARAVMAVVRDISEKKKKDEALFLRGQLLDKTSDGVIALDKELNVIYVNEAWCRIHGYSVSEIVGNKLSNILKPQRDIISLDQIEESGDATYETLHVRKDGSTFPVEVHMNRIHVGERELAVGIILDITEHKKAEEQLKQSEANFRYSIDNSPVGIRIVTTDGETLYTNRAMANLCGYDSAEELDATPRHVLYTPYSYLAHLERVAKRKNGEQVPSTYTISINRKDGVVVHLLVSRAEVFWNNNKQYQMVYQDITEQEKAEETTRLYEARLESLLKISQYKADSTQKFLEFALGEAIELTDSKIGYIYFYDEVRKEFTLNTWSKEVMQNCKVVNPQTIYELDKTGIWGEVVRQRKFIIVNDYQAPNPLKKGYPEGHSQLDRWMSIPVFTGEKIVAVVGIANKPNDYDQTDVRQLTLLMDSVWKYVERIKTEKELQENEIKFRGLFNNISSCVAIYEAVNRGSDFIIKDFNKSAQKVEQVSKDEILGKPITAVFPGVREFGLFTALQRVWQTGNPERFPLSFYRDGRISGWRDNYIYKLPTGEIVAAYEDITERKRAEEALRKSEENLRASMETSPAGILIATYEAKELYANKAFFSDIYGYSSLEELVSVPPEKRFTLETVSFFKAKIEQVKREGFVPDRHEVSIIRKDGEVRYLLLSVAEVLWNGSPQLQMAYQDITERKLAENRINRLNEVLGTIRTINELIVEIEDENELLQKACLALANSRSYKLARIGFIQEGSYDIKPVAQAGFAIDYLKSLKVTWDDSEYGRNPSGMAIKTGKPVVIQDVDADENFRLWRDTASKYGFASVAALPLTVRDKVIGMLAVYSEIRDVFNEDEIGLLKELAGDISLGITKIRQRIETARSEAKYAALVNNSNDGIIILQDSLVKFSSNHMNKMTGFSPVEYLNKPFLNFVAPEYRELVIERFNTRMAGQEVFNRYEIEILAKDNKPIPVELNVSIIEYEGRPAEMAIVRDIRERKQAEEALRKSEENFRTSMDNSPAGIIIADANYKITYANHAFLDMHGYSSIEEFKAVPTGRIEESANPQFLAALKDIKEGRQLKESQPNRGEIIVKHKNGEVRHLSVSLAKIFWNGVQQVQLVFLDITELKQAERQLNDSYEKLQKTFDGVIKVMSASIELRDPYTAGHQIRVAQLARALACEMDLTEERANQIYTTALIHDIGKISIPAEILSKPGKLNKLEFSLIQRHPETGYDILKNIEFPYPVAKWVLEHHERINGSGYPNKLQGDQISLEAKILAVADVVESISSHRPYRPSLGIPAALEEITKNKNVLYDGKIVDASLRLFNEKGFRLE